MRIVVMETSLAPECHSNICSKVRKQFFDSKVYSKGFETHTHTNKQ